MVKMSVIIGVLFRRIELVDGKPTRHAVEQLRDRAVFSRDDRLPPGRDDVEGFMTALTAHVKELRFQVLGLDPETGIVRRLAMRSSGTLPIRVVDGCCGDSSFGSGLLVAISTARPGAFVDLRPNVALVVAAAAGSGRARQ